MSVTLYSLWQIVELASLLSGRGSMRGSTTGVNPVDELLGYVY